MTVTVTEQILRGALLGSSLVVSLVFVFGFLKFVITSKRQSEAIRAASAYERERKALRSMLAYERCYSAKFEEYARGRNGNWKTKQILESAPPTDRLIAALERKDWALYERILSGRK